MPVEPKSPGKGKICKFSANGAYGYSTKIQEFAREGAPRQVGGTGSQTRRRKAPSPRGSAGFGGAEAVCDPRTPPATSPAESGRSTEKAAIQLSSPERSGLLHKKFTLFFLWSALLSSIITGIVVYSMRTGTQSVYFVLLLMGKGERRLWQEISALIWVRQIPLFI